MSSRSNGMLFCVKPARRNGYSMFTERPSLDAKTEPPKDYAEFSVVRAFLRTNPYRQNTCRTQERNEPVQRGFESVDRVHFPFNQSYVVLTVRKATGLCCRNPIISAAVQLKQSVGTLRARHDNSMKL